MTILACSACAWAGFHLAWITAETHEQNVRYLEVGHWVQGEAPLPMRIPLRQLGGPGTPPPPPPPPPPHENRQGVLVALNREQDGWREVARFADDQGAAIAELAAKLRVAQSVTLAGVQFDRKPERFPVVSVSISAGDREVRRLTVTEPEFEILGLPPGEYTMTATASGYRQRQPSPFTVRTCACAVARLETYGVADWIQEQIAPAVSLAKAAVMVAREYITTK